ncbi:MAG: tetratricopeptide repeat protein [Tepidisphaerales bacterium]
MEPRILRLIAQMADPDGSVRETADVTLRNLPISAFPVIERVVSAIQDTLPPEPAARIKQYRKIYARLAALDRERREQALWIRRQMVAAFDDSSHGGPAVDADARQTVLLSTQWTRSEADEARLLAVCRKAMAAGADDPVFLYYAALVEQRHSDIQPRQVIAQMLKAAEVLTRERRAPIMAHMIRCNAMAIAAKSPADRDWPELSIAINLSLSLGWHWEKEQVPPALLCQWAWQILDSGSHRSAYGMYAGQMQQALRRLIPGSVYLMVLEAMAHRYEAVSQSYTFEDRPGPDAAKSRERSLQRAEELLDKARKMEPENSMVLREMMLLYAQTGRDDEAEKCYRAAMAADPDDVVTASRRLDSLGEGQLEFARGLLKQENWRGGLPFLLVEWHAERSRFAGDNIAYFAKPEVKADIQAVYERYLRLFPKDGIRRSEYARYMALCQMWPEADRQMRLLGDNWSPRVFGSQTAFEYARTKTAKMAAAPGGANAPASTGRAIP